MNLRKKKKRLKKQVESMRAELDSLKRVEQPVVKVEHPRVETLRAETYVDIEDAHIPSEVLFNLLIRRYLMEEVRKYIRYQSEGPIRGGDCYRYAVELRVVVPDGGDGF